MRQKKRKRKAEKKRKIRSRKNNEKYKPEVPLMEREL